jgi:hypothetical protein
MSSSSPEANSTADGDSGRRDRPLLYATLLAAVMVGTFFYELRTKDIFGCQPAASPAHRYLAYCNVGGYFDYDHGAFWLGLEPEATRAASAADVLFLGSSRVQFALSTDVTRQWFASHELSFYLLGFSYSENVTFTTPLLKSLEPRASAYVINVDHFFETHETIPAADVWHGEASLSRYRRKQIWQTPHRVICEAVPWVCANHLAFFRDVRDGTWSFQGDEGLVPAPVAALNPRSPEQIAKRVEVANAFIAKLPVPRSCVFMTVVPSGETPWEEAEAFAAGAGVELFAPDGEGLRTFDDSHLDGRSAERWSMEFLAMAGDKLASCVASGKAHDRVAAAAPAGAGTF